MDSIIAKQKLKQDIENNNSFANMLEDMYYAFESYISEIKHGKRDATLRIPPICQSAMTMLGVVDEYRFIDALCLGLSDYAFQSVYSGGLSIIMGMMSVLIRGLRKSMILSLKSQIGERICKTGFFLKNMRSHVGDF